MVVEQVAFGLVGVDIDAFLLQLGHQALHQRRGVDEAEHPVAEDRSLDEAVDLVHGRVGRQVADALAGQGEVLGVGGGDHGIASRRRRCPAPPRRRRPSRA